VGNGTVYGAEEEEHLPVKNAPPVKKFKCGPCVAAIWEKEITVKDRDGKTKQIKLQSVTFQRKYRDKKTGEWKNSASIPTDNLADLRMLCDACAVWIKLKDVTDSSKDLENAINF
jgi:hypothetical protein